MLTPETALRKDRNAAPATMQHRHFATIAAIIAEYGSVESPSEARAMARHFADRLTRTNPNFDRARFLRACGV